MELTVACVLRSGGAYHGGHVAGLQAQAAHWLPGARFVCLTDMPVPCERIPLESDWPGWWSKIELFRHFKDRTLYLDLDTVIVGDPAALVTGQFLMIRNWVYQHLFASGVMSWDGDYSHITRAFAPVAADVMARYTTRDQWGDQAFIAEQAGDVQAFPDGEIVSYRYNRRRAMGAKPGFHGGLPPSDAKIVAFNNTDLPWHGPQWARVWWASQPIAP